MTATRRIANPIAVRQYDIDGEPDRKIVLTIGKPRRDPRPGGDWMCSVLIEGIPKERRRRIYGIDAVQALQLAMVYARGELDGSGLRLRWLDGEPGDVGLPLPVTGCHGFQFQRALEQSMEREVERMNEIAAAKRRDRERAGAAEELLVAGPRSCGFCGKTEAETRLVAGPAANICGPCARLACGVVGIPAS